MYLLRIILFFCFLSAVFESSVWADATESMLINISCQKDPLCRHPSEIIKTQMNFCEIELKTHQCDQFINTHPEYKSSARKCDYSSLCQNTALILGSEGRQACLKGFLNATKDGVTATKDLILKTSSSLNPMLWASLLSAAMSNDPKALSEIDPEVLKKLAVAVNDISKPKINSEQVQAIIKKVNETHTKIYCLNPLIAEEIKCYIAGGIVDPLLISSYALSIASRWGRGGRVKDVVKDDLKYVHTGHVEEVLGQRIRTLDSPHLPPSLRIAEYRNNRGELIKVYEQAVELPNGEIRIIANELPIDRLTGAIDANYSGGKEFLNILTHEKSKDITIASIDINSVSNVNQKFALGAKAGDEYIKAMYNSIKKTTQGRAEIIRTGGDEFTLVIHEKDPTKVQQLLDQIINDSRNPETHKIFREEKKHRVQQFKNETQQLENETQEAYLTRVAEFQTQTKEFIPYSREGISVGASKIGQGESYGVALARAEKQAQRMKIKTKEALNADARKYGGLPPQEGKKPDQKYLAKAELPDPGVDRNSLFNSRIRRVAITDDMKYAQLERLDELYHLGSESVARYRDPMGKISLRSERYFIDSQGVKRHTTRDVYLNERTQLIDGRHVNSQRLISAFVEDKKVPHRGAVWINAENLGFINYFKQGTQTGDRLLKFVSETIQKEVKGRDIPIKLSGSEFFIAMRDLPSSEVAKITKKIETALSKNPQIQKIYNEQENYLLKELKNATQTNNTGKISETQEALGKLSESRKKLFTVEGVSITESDNYDSLLKKLRQNRYPDD